MANSTETYWAVDGVSLQTFATNIETWGGDRQSMPSLRGSDITVPSRIGQIWQPKVIDSRIITLDMWVIGADADGKVPTTKTLRQQFEENWNAIRNLLWAPGRQMVLTKRFYPPGSSTLTTATALAEFSGGLVPRMTGNNRAMFSVDLKLAHPFFEGDPVTVAMPSATRTKTFTVAGDYLVNDRFSVEFNGSLAQPRLTVTGGGNIRYNGTIGAGDKVTADIGNYSAYYDAASGSDFYVSGKMVSSMSPKWLTLPSGPVTVTAAADSGTGTVNLIYRPQWL